MNQPLATLATALPRHSPAQSWHSQPGIGTVASQVFSPPCLGQFGYGTFASQRKTRPLQSRLRGADRCQGCCWHWRWVWAWRSPRTSACWTRLVELSTEVVW